MANPVNLNKPFTPSTGQNLGAVDSGVYITEIPGLGKIETYGAPLRFRSVQVPKDNSIITEKRDRFEKRNAFLNQIAEAGEFQYAVAVAPSVGGKRLAQCNFCGAHHNWCVFYKDAKGNYLGWSGTDCFAEVVKNLRLPAFEAMIEAVKSERSRSEKFRRTMEKINDFKAHYRSPFPKLAWQFVAFGHNEHEIGLARARAKDLNMRFNFKLSWDDLYGESFSSVRDRDLIRAQSGLKVADRREYEKKYGRSYIESSCHQVWLNPRVNFDGRLLGCSINHWGDYGNVFEKGLEACLTGEKMTAARRLLMGSEKEKDDLPCLNCKVYQGRMKRSSFVSPDNLHEAT